MSARVKIVLFAILVLGIAAVFWRILPERTDNDLATISMKEPDPAGSAEPTGTAVARKEANASESPGEVGAERIKIDKTHAVTLYGRVLDEAGDPVSEAVIQETSIDADGSLDHQRGNSPARESWKETSVKTDAKGEFCIEFLRHQLPLTSLRILHPEFRPEMIPAIVAVPAYDGSMRLEDVRLHPAFFVRGIVVDQHAKPVVGCTVSAPIKPWEEISGTWWDRVETDREGRFELSLVNNRPVQVTAFFEGVGTGWCSKVSPARGADVPDLTITLERCSSIAGMICYPDESPAVGQKLIIEGKSGSLKVKRSTKADDSGRFDFASLPETLYRITVEPVDICGSSGAAEEDLVLAEKLVPGIEDLILFLPLGSDVVVDLRETSGDPVLSEPRARFYFMFETEEGDISSVTSDWSRKLDSIGPGTFRFRNVQPGKYFITLWAEGYTGYRSGDIVVPEPPAEVRLEATLARLGGMRGKVFHRDETPAEGVCVQWEKTSARQPRSNDRPRATFTNDGIRRRSCENSKGGATVTDERGAFRFENLSQGEYYLFFSIDGKEVFKMPFLLGDALRAEVEIHLPEVIGGIEGLVVDSRSRPIPNALVLAWNGEDLFYRTRSDEFGRYRLTGLPDGDYVVDARSFPLIRFDLSGYRTMSVREGYEDLEQLGAFNAKIPGGVMCHLDLLVSDPWSSVVSGVIKTSTGRLPHRLHVALKEVVPEPRDRERRRPKASDLFHYSDYRGADDMDPHIERFRFDNLKAGQYQLIVSWGRKLRERLRSDTFTLDAHSHHQLILPVAFASIEGTVVDGQTEVGVGEARVILQGETNNGQWRHFEIVTDEAGMFIGTDIPVGTYDLIIRHNNYSPFLTRDFRILDSQNQVGLQYCLEPGFTLKGRLVINRKADTEHPRWYVYPSFPPLGTKWSTRGNRVERSGIFTLKGLPAGPVKLVVQDGSDPVMEHELILPVSDGEEVVINIEAD